MRLFQAALDTCLDSPFLFQPLSSRFALHGLRALESQSPTIFYRKFVLSSYMHQALGFFLAADLAISACLASVGVRLASG